MKFLKLTLIFCLASFALTIVASEQRDGVNYLNAQEANRLLLDDSTIQVLDVRTAREFAEGHIADAINIDYYAEDFKEQVGMLDPSKTYLVHCRSGGRSARSLEILKSAGMRKLVHLDGGMKAWVNGDYPVQ